jgi:two-component system sensor histidine kinase ChvG
MTAEPALLPVPPEDPPAPQGALARLRQAGLDLRQRASSSLTRRIVLLNLAGLVALLLGFLYLNQFREGLIEARVQSLLTQGEIIAGAIAASAYGRARHDHDRSRPPAADAARRNLGLGDDAVSPLEFSINPERVAPLLRRLVTRPAPGADLRPGGRGSSSIPVR